MSLEDLEEISHRIALRTIEVSGADVSSVAPDMTNLATFIDTRTARAPVNGRDGG